MKYTTYDDLLDFALANADSFSLTWCNLAFESTAFDMLDKLSPWLISDYSSNSWPGTELFGDRAKVKTYEVTVGSIEVLRCVDSVFSLLAPEYPEDLALYKNKEVLFGSVAHDGSAWYA